MGLAIVPILRYSIFPRYRYSGTWLAAELWIRGCAREGASGSGIKATPSTASYQGYIVPVVFEAVPLGGGYCDFCCSRSIFKVYKCSNFECCGRAVFSSARTGAWASCRKCSELVDGKQWSRLTQRALTKFLARHEVSHQQIPTLRAQFAEIHKSFAEHLLKET